jgi:hypothetical protein
MNRETPSLDRRRRLVAQQLVRFRDVGVGVFLDSDVVIRLEVIENGDVVTAASEAFRDMPADEAGTAGNEGFPSPDFGSREIKKWRLRSRRERSESDCLQPCPRSSLLTSFHDVFLPCISYIRGPPRSLAPPVGGLLHRDRDSMKVRSSGTGERLIVSYISLYNMGKTIRVSEEYHTWIKAHNREDETMEETLRRLTRGPHPSDVAGMLTTAEAKEAKEAVSSLRNRDTERFEKAREAFEE